MNCYRGIVNWDFIGLALEKESIYENNDALFKSRHGNSLFAIFTGISFLFLIIFTFFTEKIFKHRGIYCKIFSILCFPCPNNCLNFESEMSTSHSLQSNPITQNKDGEQEDEQLDSPDKAPDTKEPRVQVYIYPQRKKKSLIERQSSEQGFEMKEVNIVLVE